CLHQFEQQCCGGEFDPLSGVVRFSGARFQVFFKKFLDFKNHCSSLQSGSAQSLDVARVLSTHGMATHAMASSSTVMPASLRKAFSLRWRRNALPPGTP